MLVLDGRFDFPTARVLLAQCERSYLTADIGSDIAHCLTEFVDGAWVLAFRGTEDARDVLTDIEIRRTDIGAGERMHHGILNAAMSIAQRVKDFLAGHQTAPVVLTGHSLGGAVAQCVAWELFHANFSVKLVMTFGSPRLANFAWADKYTMFLGHRTWRVVDDLDIVPRVPFWGYKHTERPALVTDAGVFLSPPWWQILYRDALALYRDWREHKLSAIEDHFAVAGYGRRLAALTPNQIF